MEGYTHQASLIILDEEINTITTKEIIAELLGKMNDIDFGITTAPINGIIIRILGNKAEQLHNCLKTIATLVQQQNIE